MAIVLCDPHTTVVSLCQSIDLSLKDLHRSPEWDKCRDWIPKWSEVSLGRTSDELVDLLLNEIQRIPSDRRMSRRKLSLVIKDIWSTKPRVSFTEFFFLEQRHFSFFPLVKRSH